MNEEFPDQLQRSKSGWKKILIVVVLLFVAAIGGLVCLVLPPKEPFYKGKSLSYWLTSWEEFSYGDYNSKDPKAVECREAIRNIGTNAIPSLLRMLKASDSSAKSKLVNLMGRQRLIDFHFLPAAYENNRAVQGFWCLDELATSAIPALVKISTNPPSQFSKEAADSVLMAIFPASGAIPYWVPPRDRFRWYYEAGQLKSQLGTHSNAILAFSEALKLNPTNAATYLSRAIAKIQLEDFAGALNDAKRTTELNSSNYTAFYVSGLCRFASKDFKSADIDFTRAIDLNTNLADAYNYRGLSRANLRKLDEALEDFNEAVELEPGEATSYRNRALVESVQTNYELALADASKSIELNPEDPARHEVRGNIQMALKDFESAAQDFEKVIKLDPKMPSGYAGRGATRMLMNDYENASVDIEKALQLEPKYASAYVARGWLKAKRGDEDKEVMEDFERAFELSSPSQAPEMYGNLGVFQYKMSQWVPALENCRKALDLGISEAADGVRFYVWLILAQTGKEVDANRDLKSYLQSLSDAKAKEWDASIARFLTGSLSESDFLGQATTVVKRPSAVRSQVCESFYYAGMKRKLANDLHGALELFQKCLDTKENNSFAFINAAVEMSALKKQNAH